MAQTRISVDDCRTIKKLQQMTDPGKYILDVPGNGYSVPYKNDPFIRMQKWNGQIYTESIDLESQLIGYNRYLNHDIPSQDEYTKFDVISNRKIFESNEIKPSCMTSQSRTTNPVWWYRDTPLNIDTSIIPYDPQKNVCYRFQNQLNSRILMKDRYELNNLQCQQ